MAYRLTLFGKWNCQRRAALGILHCSLRRRAHSARRRRATLEGGLLAAVCLDDPADGGGGGGGCGNDRRRAQPGAAPSPCRRQPPGSRGDHREAARRGRSNARGRRRGGCASRGPGNARRAGAAGRARHHRAPARAAGGDGGARWHARGAAGAAACRPAGAVRGTRPAPLRAHRAQRHALQRTVVPHAELRGHAERHRCAERVEHHRRADGAGDRGHRHRGALRAPGPAERCQRRTAVARLLLHLRSVRRQQQHLPGSRRLRSR